MLKSQGVKLGRKSNLTDEVKSKVIELSNKGISPTKIARQFKIGVSTCYKVIKENAKQINATLEFAIEPCGQELS